MSRNPVLYKTLVVGIVFLFIGIMIPSNISGFIQKEFVEDNHVMDVQTLVSFNITVETDKDYYFHGETITFFGQLSKDGVGFKARIEYELIDPRNYNIFGGMMYTESSGHFNISYTIHSNAINGEYSFKVEYYENPSVFATTYFEVFPSLEIESINGRLGKINAQIRNIRGKDLNNVTLSISVVPTIGIFLFEEILIEEKIPLFKENETVSIQTNGFFIGIGKIEVYVKASVGYDENTIIRNGFIILIFIII